MIRLQFWPSTKSLCIEKSQNLKNFLPPGRTWTNCQQGELNEDPSLCGCCTEDEIVEVGRRVKAVNPNAMVWAYMHHTLAHPQYRAAHNLATHEKYWMRNASGGVNCEAYPWLCYDHSKLHASRFWEEQSVNITLSGFVDSIYVDGCTKGPSNVAPDYDKAAFFQNKKDAMLRMQEKMAGPVICGSGGDGIPGLGGVELQNWGNGQSWSTREIPMLQRAMAAGQMFQAHSRHCLDDTPDDPVLVNGLAAFLVAAGPYSYWMCGGWTDKMPVWYPLYDYPLGAPLSNASFINGIYSRKFSSGTSVTFDTKTETGAIHWAHTRSIAEYV